MLLLVAQSDLGLDIIVQQWLANKGGSGFDDILGVYSVLELLFTLSCH